MTTCCITWVVPSLCRMPPFLQILKMLFYLKVACHGFSGISCVCMWEAWWTYHKNFMGSSRLTIEWQSFPAHVPTLKILNPFTALTRAPTYSFNIPKTLCKTGRSDKEDQRESREQADTGTAVGHTAQWPGQATMLSLVNSGRGGGRHRERMGGHRHSLIMLHGQRLQQAMLERWEPWQPAMFILNACVPPQEILHTDLLNYC